MNSTSSSAAQPTPSQAELLGLLLDQMLERRGGVPYFKFRSGLVSRWAELDQMEADGWIKHDNGNYFVQSTIVPLIETQAAHGLLRDIELIYAVLRQQYELTVNDPVKVLGLAASTHLAPDRVLQVLRLMIDTVLWHMGSSLNVLIEDAFVCPGEKILQFGNFTELAAHVRGWRRTPNFFPSALYEPVRPKTPPETPQSFPEPHMPVVNAWPPARSCLMAFRFDVIKDIAGLAGFDVTATAELVQGGATDATKGQLLAAIDSQFREMEDSRRTAFLTALMEEMLIRKPELEEKLSGYLSRLGWSFTGGKLLPLALFDPSALDDMPADAHPELLKAAQRLRTGDLGGAISAAAAAVDAAVSKVYEEANLGDPTDTSFQTRCKHALAARGILVDLDDRLAELRWKKEDVVPFARSLESALIKGAFVMQTLRSNMGDVHGSKPILRALVFDSLRWAELLVGALVVKESSQDVSS